MIRKRDEDSPGEDEPEEPRRGSPCERFRTGWVLPLEMDSRGRLVDERPSPLASTARLILEIVPGERRFLPEFGCRIHFLRSLSEEGERQLGGALVEEALERWAPSLGVDRAEVLSVEDGLVRLLVRAKGEWHEVSITHRPETHRSETHRSETHRSKVDSRGSRGRRFGEARGS